MSKKSDIGVLAIDGGGTRSRYAYVCGDARYDVELGPTNVFTDFAGAVACLKEGLATLLEKAALPPGTLGNCPAFVGLAGVTTQATHDKLKAALPLKNAEYADDRLPALRGALGNQNGVIAHCGTGSFLAAQVDGEVKLAGGWGHLLGDEASAYWVGKTLLAKTLSRIDGLEAPSDLHDEVFDQLKDANGILEFARGATPKDIAALAPLVTRNASLGDPAGKRIMQMGADYLSAGLDQLGWRPGFSLCLAGGIGPYFAPYLPVDKQERIVPAKGSSLDGAVALAQDRAART